VLISRGKKFVQAFRRFSSLIPHGKKWSASAPRSSMAWRGRCKSKTRHGAADPAILSPARRSGGQNLLDGAARPANSLVPHPAVPSGMRAMQGIAGRRPIPASHRNLHHGQRRWLASTIGAAGSGSGYRHGRVSNGPPAAQPQPGQPSKVNSGPARVQAAQTSWSIDSRHDAFSPPHDLPRMALCEYAKKNGPAGTLTAEPCRGRFVSHFGSLSRPLAFMRKRLQIHLEGIHHERCAPLTPPGVGPLMSKSCACS
jgi:hypothetical protein